MTDIKYNPISSFKKMSGLIQDISVKNKSKGLEGISLLEATSSRPNKQYNSYLSNQKYLNLKQYG